MLLTAAVILIVLIIVILVDIRRPHRFPPGPKWLPFVGNFPTFQIEKRKFGFCHLVLADFAKTYGEITGLRLGNMLLVSVSGSAAVKEVLTRDEFDGRPDGFLFRLRTFGERLGIALSDGEFWKGQRKFCMQYLRKFGLGRKDMELIVFEEARELVDCLRSKCAQPITINNTFDISVLNVLWALLAGERFSLDNPRLAGLLSIIHDAFRIVDFGGGIVNQLPFLRFVAPEYSGYKQSYAILKRTWQFLEEVIDEQKKTFSVTHSRGLIDAFLQQMTELQGQSDTFTEKQLLSICLDLMMAGSETTSNTLSFAMLYMLKYPEIQKKVQDELDEVLGRNRSPTPQDRLKLPYTEAVIMEIQRICSVAPLAVPHRTMRDTELRGYCIPKDTVVIINIYSVHMDPKFWKNPSQFHPERFLNDKGSLSIPDWYFIPFGQGKRRCLGESLAKTSLFLFFTSILNNFHIKNESPDCTGHFEIHDGLTLSPKPFKVRLVPR
ncbi:methyl farnesoate epoxidase-like [Agrilus planipennis]|uniref:Methyl farnesoate epoxidase-like n=1 Tax=Agrilus planipennis TaxID=224129 RepID=A0A1W4WXR8_AGRPL|nr:methyl farnesoate epoxidase-like [Agrilus planipennis]